MYGYKNSLHNKKIDFRLESLGNPNKLLTFSFLPFVDILFQEICAHHFIESNFCVRTFFFQHLFSDLYFFFCLKTVFLWNENKFSKKKKRWTSLYMIFIEKNSSRFFMKHLPLIYCLLLNSLPKANIFTNFDLAILTGK